MPPHCPTEPCPQCSQIHDQWQQSAEQEAAQKAQMVAVGMQVPESQVGPEPPVPVLLEAYEGSPEIYVRDPRFVYIEPGAESIEKAQWFLVRMPLPVSMLRRMFPEYAEFINADDGMVSEKAGVLRYAGLDPAITESTLSEHAFYWEYHERPTETYKTGRVIYRVNNLVVGLLDGEEERPENPYNILGRLPIYHIGFEKNAGEFWRESFIAQTWHRQRELNRNETQQREHIENCLKPKMFIPIGSRITQEEITASTGQLIHYNAAAGTPLPVQFPPLPQDVFRRREMLIQDIRQLAGITEQEAGLTSSDPNGRAMAIISAEADQQMGPIVTRNLSEWRELHRGYLQLFKSYAHPETKWSIAGPEGMQLFSFEELKLEDGWDIQVEQEDGMSRNPAIRLQQSLDF